MTLTELAVLDGVDELLDREQQRGLERGGGGDQCAREMLYEREQQLQRGQLGRQQIGPGQIAEWNCKATNISSRSTALQLLKLAASVLAYLQGTRRVAGGTGLHLPAETVLDQGRRT